MAGADKRHVPVSFAIWLRKALVADWKVGSREKSGDFFPSLCFGKLLKVVAVSPWLQTLLESRPILFMSF